MDDYELDMLSKELEADLTESFKQIDQELDSRTSTLNVEDYEKIQKVGQGTFGEVFKVRHKVSKKVYALKRLKMELETEGFPITALREIRILQSLEHKNVVSLCGICHRRNLASSNYRYEFYLLFDFCDHDLAGLLSQKIQFTLPIKKAIMKQLLTGLKFLHGHCVMHRDLKASNILIHQSGILKIADFGLARISLASQRAERQPRYTGRVVTLWYRPPEILLNDRRYGFSVDLWGAGCIMAELWTKCPLLQGENEISQLNLIIQLCGSITPSVWPEVERLETFRQIKLPRDVKRSLREKLAAQVPSASALDLIDRLLAIDPSRRLNACQALLHDFFTELPTPGDLASLSQGGATYLEYLSHANRSRQAAANRNRIRSGAGTALGRAIPGGMSGAITGAAGQFRYRGLPAEQDSSINFDRIY